MVLITNPQYEALVKAGHGNMDPIVKLFMSSLTWLVTGIEDDVLYGYADLGMQCVEWGGLCLVEELPSMKVHGAWLERDYYFKHRKGINYLDLETLTGI